MARRWHYHYYNDGFAPYGAVLCGMCYTRASVQRRRAAQTNTNLHHMRNDSAHATLENKTTNTPTSKRIRTAEDLHTPTPCGYRDNAIDGSARRALKAQGIQPSHVHTPSNQSKGFTHIFANTSTHPHASSSTSRATE